jgi:hypothetical protein
MGFDCLPFRTVGNCGVEAGNEERDWYRRFSTLFLLSFPQRLSRLVRYLTARGKGSVGIRVNQCLFGPTLPCYDRISQWEILVHSSAPDPFP